MELHISICTEHIHRTYRLTGHKRQPALYELIVPAAQFKLRTSQQLLFRYRNQCWQICHNVQADCEQTFQSMTTQSAVSLKTIHGDYLWVILHDNSKFDSSSSIPSSLYSLKNHKTITIGRKKECTICLAQNSYISSLHACISEKKEGYYLEPYGTNGIYLNGAKLRKSALLRFGDVIWIYTIHMMILNNHILIYQTGDYTTSLKEETFEKIGLGENYLSGADLKKYLHPSPRVLIPLKNKPIELEGPPAIQPYRKPSVFMTIGPAFTMALPMLLGFSISSYASANRGHIGIGLGYSGIITAVVSGMLGTIWACLNLKNSKKMHRQNEAERAHSYERYIKECEHRIKVIYEHNFNTMNSMYPSGEICCHYHEHSYQLWNRNHIQGDHLFFRIGIGSVPFQANIIIPKEKFIQNQDELIFAPAQLRQKYQYLYNVPVGIDCLKHRLICILGKDKEICEIFKCLITQIVSGYSYCEVKIVCLLEHKEETEELDRMSLKWLPHLWSENGKVRFLDYNEGSTEGVVYELCQIFKKREEVQRELQKEQELLQPHYILLIDNYRRFLGENISEYAFSKQKICGITSILSANHFEELPNDCDLIIQNDSQYHGYYSISDSYESRQKVNFDYISNDMFACFSRRMAGIEVKVQENLLQIEKSVSLFDLFHIQDPVELQIEERWRTSRTDLYMKAPIGLKAGGRICYLDIHEKAHGPHGLVAGMTGSGKSEILQTYIISMAICYPPEEIGFFLIDYKGGGMANLFEQLPHVVGSISNLSGSDIRRAMVSIKSENKRRQELFGQYGINNIHEYIRLFKGGHTREPLPHILIIIDEFAELKKEEPDFMKELISVAQVGRSLGIHLILATQKPAGTVDDNIRSNSKFRLCLRVQDRQDSSDMLQCADAAYLIQAGRGYLQVGNDEIFELFQSAYSAAEYNPDGNRYENAATMIDLSGTEEVVCRKRVKTEEKQTQLNSVIEEILRIRSLDGRQKEERIIKLWLPELNSSIGIQELLSGSELIENRSYKNEISVVIGMYDIPEQQCQKPLFIRLCEGGHHAVCGMLMSGKSVFLQTVVYQFIQEYTSEEINIYIIDFSSQQLYAFEDAPQIGCILGEHDLMELKKLFYMMKQVLSDRKELLKGGNFRQYIQTVKPITCVVIIIDNYAMFREKTGDIFETEILELLRTGENCGIYLIVTATGFGGGELPNRLGENFRTTISLGMSDKYQYASILRVNRVERCPKSGVPGRGLVLVDDQPLEFQTAILSCEPDDYVRAEEIKKACKIRSEQLSQFVHAKRLPGFSEQMRYQMFFQSEEVSFILKNRKEIPFGYYVETGAPVTIKLRESYCYFIMGRAGTGKTNLMKILVAAAMEQKMSITLIDDERKELESYCSVPEVTYYSEDNALYLLIEKLGEMFRERNQIKEQCKKEGMSLEEHYEVMSKQGIQLIFIHNLSDFIKRVEERGTLKGTCLLLQNLFKKGSGHHIYFIAAQSLEQEIEIRNSVLYEAFIRYKTGVWLGGACEEQRIFDFGFIPYKEQAKRMKTGYGIAPAIGNDEALRGEVWIPRYEHQTK